MATSNNQVEYACSPAGLNENDLDNGNSDHVKMYQAAVAQLEPKLDRKSRELLRFLEGIRGHTKESNQKYILLVPDASGNNHNLLTRYGQLTFVNVQAYAETYVGMGGRKEQNSTQMFTCLSHSLTEEAKESFKSQSTSYWIGAKDLANGPCYLRLIIQKCTPASCSTVANIWNSLSTLPAYMDLVKGDIERFTKHVCVLCNSLLQCWEHCPDLLINLCFCLVHGTGCGVQRLYEAPEYLLY